MRGAGSSDSFSVRPCRPAAESARSSTTKWTRKPYIRSTAVAWLVSQTATSDIGLAEFLAAIRDELLAAQGKATNPILKLEDVEVEISIAATIGADGGIKLWVISLGGKYSKERTHTVKLKLTPLRPITPARK
jgi:Trypsin-co-occurring domain 2